jgi:serine/threonine protein kinase/WD40 repeat protein
VLRARDRELGRSLAIKELLSLTPSSELRFFREALITARLEHPNIVPVHEAGRWPDGTPFYAMKLVAGRPLKELIDGTTTLSQRLELLPHVLAVADAVGYAHSRGVVHRDLKPSNVIVGDFGETVVIDWGLAKHVDDTTPDAADMPAESSTPPQVTGVGGVVGTLAFMSPEQAAGKASLQSDIYSIGVILYNVVTGRVPPHAPASMGVEPLALPSSAPKDLAAIVRKATQPNLSARYRDVTALIDDLKRFQQRRPVSARRYSLRSRFALAISRDRRLSFAILTFVCLLAMTLLGGLVSTERQRQRAVVAETVAQRSRGDAENRLVELARSHAKSLLNSDPSAVSETVRVLPHEQRTWAEMMRATAKGRGIPESTMRPHRDPIFLVDVTPEGHIVSAAWDSRLVVTDIKTRASRLVASGIAISPPPLYDKTTGTFAYTRRSEVVSVDVETGQEEVLAFGQGAIDAFSVDFTKHRAAVITRTGELYSLVAGESVRHHGSTPGARRVELLNDDRVVVVDAAGVRVWDGSHSELLIAGEVIDVSLDAERTYVAAVLPRGQTAVGDGTRATIKVWKVCDREAMYAVVLTRAELGYVCDDGSAGVIDTARGSTLRSFAVDGTPRSVAGGPDGTYFLVATESGTVYVSSSSEPVRLLRGHESSVYSVAASLTNRLIVSGSGTGYIRAWSPVFLPGRYVATHGDESFTLAFSPTADSLFVGGFRGPVHRWSTTTGECTVLEGTTKQVFQMVAPSASDYVATVNSDGTMRTWDISSGAPLAVVRPPTDMFMDLDVLPDRETVVAASRSGEFIAWSPRSGETSLMEPLAPLINIEVLQRSGDVAVAHADGRLSIGRPGETRTVLVNTQGTPVRRLEASPSGNWLAWGDSASAVMLYSPATGSTVRLATLPGLARRFAFSPDDRFLAVVTEQENALLFQIQPFVRLVWAMDDVPSRYVVFDPTTSVLAITGTQGDLRLYSLQFDRWRVFSAHTGEIPNATFDASGRWLASVDLLGAVTLLDVAQSFENDPGEKRPNSLPRFQSCKEPDHVHHSQKRP